MRTAEASGQSRRIGATIAIVLAVSCVGLASMHADRLQDALGAKQTLGKLVEGGAGAVTGAEFVALALAGAAAVFMPLVVIGLLAIIELWGGKPGRSAKDRGLAWAVQALFLTVATFLAIGIVALGLIAETPLLAPGGSGGRAASLLEILALFLLALPVIDLLRYWVHRAQHSIPFLWKFHAVHHSPEDLDVLHNITHPVEKLVNLLLITVPMSWLIQMDGTQLFLVAGFFVLHGQLSHMAVPLRFGPFAAVVADNRFHFVHHSRDPKDHNSNFADLFPFIDMVFGTYRRPEGDTLASTGLPGRSTPASLGDYLLARPRPAKQG